jgi:hypothetical protein
MTRNLKNLFGPSTSIDLSEASTATTTAATSSNSNSSTSASVLKRTNSASPVVTATSKFYNTITTANFAMTASELDNLNQLQAKFAKLTGYDQHYLTHKIQTHIINMYKNLSTTHSLPKLQYLQFVFDIMESNLNIFNLLTFAIRLLHLGPSIEQYFRAKFVTNNSNNNGNSGKVVYFEYLSHFYVNIISVLRAHLLSLAMWKDLASEVFKT